MSEALYLFAAMFALVICGIARPDRIACPPGWVAEGVRLSGTTDCVRASTAPDTIDTSCGDGGRCSGKAPPEPRFPVRVYCTNGTTPIVVSHRVVGCQRFAGVDLRAERER